MNFKYFSIAFFVILAISLPEVLFAQARTYTPLIGIPGVTDPGLSFNAYINALYTLSISVAALLAVIKIIIAGMKYMLSDIVTNKQEAIGDIKGAVLGLLVVISAVLVLTVINPKLTEFDIILDPVRDIPGRPASGPSGPVPAPSPILPLTLDSRCTEVPANPTDPESTITYDCKSLEDDCATKGGESNQFNSGQKVRCLYGTPLEMPCDRSTGDCSEKQNNCHSGGGSSHVIAATTFPPKVKHVMCIYPFK